MSLSATGREAPVDSQFIEGQLSAATPVVQIREESVGHRAGRGQKRPFKKIRNRIFGHFAAACSVVNSTTGSVDAKAATVAGAPNRRVAPSVSAAQLHQTRNAMSPADGGMTRDAIDKPGNRDNV